MKVLELFSGTGSVGKCCKALGWEVVSVDMILPADHQVDIMDFDYKQYKKDEFDIVWASPPCTNYSKLQDSWLGRMRKGEIYTREIQEKEMNEDDKLVLRTLEIIDYFNPEYWFIENPAGSKMKDRPFMKDLNNYVVDYCMYSDWGYRKRTRIWTNKKDWNALKCDKNCGNMVGNLHKTNLGNADRFKRANIENVDKYSGTTQQDRYRIPEDLIFSLFMD
jgi:site-specific DNA-cytosine methylase